MIEMTTSISTRVKARELNARERRSLMAMLLFPGSGWGVPGSERKPFQPLLFRGPANASRSNFGLSQVPAALSSGFA
jgi:hypothetical protein